MTLKILINLRKVINWLKLSTTFSQMSIFNLKNSKLKSEYPYGKQFEELIDKEGISAPRKIS